MPYTNSSIGLSSGALTFALALLSLALFLAVCALQAKIRGNDGGAIGLRFGSLAAGVMAGGIIGKALIDSWYASSTAPALEWKGALWIGASIVAGLALAGIVFLVTTTPSMYRRAAQ